VVQQHHVGKRIKCPQCGGAFSVTGKPLIAPRSVIRRSSSPWLAVALVLLGLGVVGGGAFLVARHFTAKADEPSLSPSAKVEPKDRDEKTEAPVVRRPADVGPKEQADTPAPVVKVRPAETGPNDRADTPASVVEIRPVETGPKERADKVPTPVAEKGTEPAPRPGAEKGTEPVSRPDTPPPMKPADTDKPIVLNDFDKKLDDYQKLIKPQRGESKFAEIPWMRTVWEARDKAAKEGKPIFIWYMVGEPLGQC
jgi:hypothetical protein